MRPYHYKEKTKVMPVVASLAIGPVSRQFWLQPASRRSSRILVKIIVFLSRRYRPRAQFWSNVSVETEFR